MRLNELEPEFVKIIDPGTYQCEGVAIADADGIQFLCPKCFQANGGNVGTHLVLCWKPHVPQEIRPAPGRWRFEGSGFDDLSLVAGSSSVLLMGGCNAHFFVRGG